MRLHRVELFYAFLLRFRSKDSGERGAQPLSGHLQGWTATARTLVGPASYSQAPTGAANCGQGPLQG
ncbi:hypothetical protein GW17_00032293 [Ensete ventricosum]|nr:hypothetical protein GW17_00032293 [Ensete ventricosum]